MSLQFDKVLTTDSKTVLKINLTGIKDGVFYKENLKVSFYAYEKHSGKPIFSQTLDYNAVQTLFDHLNSISLLKDKSLSKTNKFIEATSEIANMLSLLESI